MFGELCRNIYNFYNFHLIELSYCAYTEHRFPDNVD